MIDDGENIIQVIHDEIKNNIYIFKENTVVMRRFNLFEIIANPLVFYLDEIVDGYIRDTNDVVVPFDVKQLIIAFAKTLNA